MIQSFYNNLSRSALSGEQIQRSTCEEILNSSDIELLPLLDAAYQVRKARWGNEVMVHILNNAQNGHCPEDCHYCAQAKTSKTDILEYPMKSDDEILAEAKAAYDSGAYRYCMVYAGRGPAPRRIEKLANLISTIKKNHPKTEVCLSAGLINDEGARKLKEAGLDRLNHNLNTSREHYPEICTTHTYDDRLNTLKSARTAGIQLCTGMIVGMGETHKDIIDVAVQLRELKAESIPVNFFIPIDGNTVKEQSQLTPQFCLRVLCLFRFLNPKCELRVAAGRELHLRDMEVMALYPANSLFLSGYLNARGESNTKTLRMIKDAGFSIRSEVDLDDLLKENVQAEAEVTGGCGSAVGIKGLKELRPKMADR